MTMDSGDESDHEIISMEMLEDIFFMLWNANGDNVKPFLRLVMHI